MKILSLHFKNLNSLYGEWKIDFTDKEYASNGIFALTGATGAGKSTILDAICLALYGQAPRLGNITKSSNEIMSRQTGECFSEIIFKTASGTYSCKWEQRRAKKKPTGTLQNPEYQIADMQSGEVLDNSRQGVLQAVEKFTGMDYARFTRTILLAQGNFNAFLKAKVEEKSSILEEITGTEIYTKISRLIHERSREEKEKLQLLKAENAHIILLSQEEIQAQNIALCEFEAKEKIFLTEKKNLEKQKSCFKNIENVQKELHCIREEKNTHDAVILAFTDQKKALEIAIKASEFDAPFSELKTLRNAQKADKEQVTLQEKNLPNLEFSLKEQEKKSEIARENLQKCKEEIEKNTPIFQEVRLLDQAILLENKNVLAQKKICNEEEEKIEKQRKALEKQNKSLETKTKELSEIKKWQAANKTDALLVQELAGIMERLKTLISMQEEGKKERTAHNETFEKQKLQNVHFEKIGKDLENETKKYEKTLKKITEERKKEKKLLDGKLLREYHTQKESLFREQSLIKQIESLEEARKNLEDGKACPLCGSLNHPYAQGNIPKNSEIEEKINKIKTHIENIEKTQAHLEKLTKEEQSQKIILVTFQNNYNNASEAKKTLDEQFKNSEKNINISIENYKKKASELEKEFLPFGIEKIPNTNLADFQSNLQKRLAKWIEQEKKCLNLDKESQEIQSNIKIVKGLLENYEKHKNEFGNTYNLLAKNLQEKEKNRTKLFADKDVKTEEKILQQTLEKAELEVAKSQELEKKNKEKLNAITIYLKNLKEQMENRLKSIQTKELDFITLLQKNNFNNEEEYLKTSLPLETRKLLQKEATLIEDKTKELQNTQKDRMQKLATLLKEGEVFADMPKTENSQVSLESLKAILDDLEQSLNSLDEKIKENTENSLKIKHILTRNAENQQALTHKKEAIEKQEKEVNRFEKLNALIGSADGKRFRNFAQGLTFELMIAHANDQLSKMSDRYLLLHDAKSALELNVLDDYLGGEIRTTLNLSGGESFIVSLALALGLSKMVSHKVRVDSLFIDEGFGTLDEETLETALATLSNIQEDGKLIGIISHIPALKERIPTQIQIMSKTGGKSTIQGAGCSHISFT